MKKFEYFTHNGELNCDQLNIFGMDGWELVSHTFLFNPKRDIQCYIFKREII